MRVGVGRDIHRLQPGNFLRLGGISIPSPVTTVAFSDGDCLAHALMDALLGAAGLENIGVLFPNSQEKNRGRNSMEMLEIVVKMLQEKHLRIENLDGVISLERPKVSDQIPSIRQNLAKFLNITPAVVGLKATTGEGVGPIGEGRAIEVICVCLLREEVDGGGGGE